MCRTRILRHMASELNLKMRNDGFVKVNDLLKLNMKTFANIPLRSHTVDDIKEVKYFHIFLCFSIPILSCLVNTVYFVVRFLSHII